MILSAKNTKFLTETFVSIFDLNYCVLRNYDSLPLEVGKDIDILISFDSLTQACDRVQDIAALYKYKVVMSNNELNGFNLVIKGDNQAINIHFQLWVSFETNIFYKKVPGFSEKVIKNQISSTSQRVNTVNIKTPAKVDEFVLLLKQVRYKNKASYQLKLKEILNGSNEKALIDATNRFKLDSEDWVQDPYKIDQLMKFLIWKVWKKQSLSNFIKALLYVINRKLK